MIKISGCPPDDFSLRPGGQCKNAVNIFSPTRKVVASAEGKRGGGIRSNKRTNCTKRPSCSSWSLAPPLLFLVESERSTPLAIPVFFFSSCRKPPVTETRREGNRKNEGRKDVKNKKRKMHAIFKSLAWNTQPWPLFLQRFLEKL